MKLVTSTYKEYNVKWCAVSSMDGYLRFEVVNVSFTDAFSVFGDKDETTILRLFIDDINTREYLGYTKLVGINQKDNIIVTLAPDNIA